MTKTLNTTSLNNETFSNNSNMFLMAELQEWCRSDPTEDESYECVLDKKTATRWYEYVLTIQYTIGK